MLAHVLHLTSAAKSHILPSETWNIVQSADVSFGFPFRTLHLDNKCQQLCKAIVTVKDKNLFINGLPRAERFVKHNRERKIKVEQNYGTVPNRQRCKSAKEMPASNILTGKLDERTLPTSFSRRACRLVMGVVALRCQRCCLLDVIFNQWWASGTVR